jgi:osmotically-inducible protein OsmY
VIYSDDEKLRYEVERAIGQEPGLRLLDFNISVDRGRVSLRGVVGRLSEKELALAAARGVCGITGVDDGIAVETSHVPSDRDLAQELDEELDEEIRAGTARVGATAQRGEAVMVGTAGSVRELADARQSAAGVRGAPELLDGARIGNPYGADPVKLVNAIADAFRRHPVLHTRMIRPLLEESGKVVLTGQVRTEDEKQEALSVASGVPGVHTVHDQLEVLP